MPEPTADVSWVADRVRGSVVEIHDVGSVDQLSGGPYDTVVSVGALERCSDLLIAAESIVGLISDGGRFVFVERTSVHHDVLSALWDGGLAVIEADHDPRWRRSRDLAHRVRGVATRRHMARPPRPELASSRR